MIESDSYQSQLIRFIVDQLFQSPNIKMKTSTNNNFVPLPYWRAALAEISLCHPDIPPENKPISFTKQDELWCINDASPNIAEWVDRQFSASKAGKNGTDGKPVKTIPFVLIAARLSAQVSHGVKSEAVDVNKGHSLLCVPCLLDRQGGLLPDPDRPPWIPRDLLEPSLKKVTIGNLDDCDLFLSKIPGKPTSLNDTFQMAARLFREVTGAGLPNLAEHMEEDSVPPPFELEGYEVVSAWHGLPYDPPIIARNLIKLYDQLIDKNPVVPLLDRLRDTNDRPTLNPIPLAESKVHYATSVGHIDQEHSLSPSQREAMTELVKLQEGGILAVRR